MNLYATPRFVTAIVVVGVALVCTLVFGQADVALLVAPWVMLLAFGLGTPLPTSPSVTMTASAARAVVGDELSMTATVTPASDAYVSVIATPAQRFRDAADSSLPEEPPLVHFVGAAQDEAITSTVRVDTWGMVNFGSARVEVESRYGLVTGAWRYEQDRDVRVHPRTEDLRRLVSPHFVRRVTGLHASTEAGRGIEFADTRDFASGDEVRHINWRASARRGTLQVADRHPDRASDVVLLLDSFVDSGHDTRRVLEMTITMALAAAAGHLGATDRVGVVEFGGVVRWLAPGTGAVQLHRLTDSLLATTQYSSAANKVLPMLAPGIWPPNSLVIAVSPLLDERFVGALREARERRHDVAVVECVPVGADAHEGESEIERAATRVWFAQRDSLRAELADVGIAVATWHAGEPVDQPVTLLRGMRRRMATQR